MRLFLLGISSIFLMVVGISLILLVNGCQDLETMGTYEKIWFNRGVYCTKNIYEWDLHRGVVTQDQADDILERAYECFEAGVRATQKRRKALK